MNKKFELTFQQTPKVPEIALKKMLNKVVDILSQLDDNKPTIWPNKIHQLFALHSKWIYKDNNEVIEKCEPLGYWRERYKAIGQVVFGFTLHEKRIRAILDLFYKQIDLIFLAKTGFSKSIIFQLLPFMTAAPRVVFILIPLKLFQAKQNQMINQLPYEITLVLNRINNHKHVHRHAVKGHSTNFFTSPEITLLKKFQKTSLIT